MSRNIVETLNEALTKYVEWKNVSKEYFLLSVFLAATKRNKICSVCP